MSTWQEFLEVNRERLLAEYFDLLRIPAFRRCPSAQPMCAAPVSMWLSACAARGH